ncbi:MAG: hypothetical protein Q8R82_01645 [Hyphomonadaceae bacterium]|nr:hypothetical protein [Hyphomonadaceae bacterium]
MTGRVLTGYDYRLTIYAPSRRYVSTAASFAFFTTFLGTLAAFMWVAL